MNKIKNVYNKFKWRDRILVLLGLAILTIAISIYSQVSPIEPTVLVVGLLVFIHLLLDKPTQLMTSIVLLAQILALPFIFSLYGQLAMLSMGNSGYMFAVLIVTLSTIILTLLSYKFSVGTLWLTLALAFVTLDLLSLPVMAFFGIYNPLAGLFLALLVTLARSILWRDFFRNKTIAIPEGIKNTSSSESIRSLVEKIEGVEIRSIDATPIDFIAITADKAYYVNTISLNNRIAVFDENVASGSTNLKSTLYGTVTATKNHAKKFKGKNYKYTVPCLVNSTDKGKSRTELNITVTGRKRDKGENVFIISPSSLVELIKKDIKESNQSMDTTEV